jgi:tRNA threonylcarbamoyladenosine biosynthesis protein TsaB
MALILNIDTATESASIALSEKDKVAAITKNKDIRDHASWIHNAIKGLLDKTGHSLSQLEAIAVTAGPGSYTGLRVGMATAKGLCYVLSIPLIVENTLKVMARAAIQNKSLALAETGNGKLETLLIPMIDARRMEVFTAVYDSELAEVMAPKAMVLDTTSFEEINNGGRLVCFGNGSQKFKTIAPQGRFDFEEIEVGAGALAHLAYQKFKDKEFADLAYTEPFYLKEFYTPSKK